MFTCYDAPRNISINNPWFRFALLVQGEQSMRSKRRLRQSHLALQSEHKRTRFFEVYRRKFKKRLYNERADKANDLAIVLDNLRSRKSAEMDRPGAPPPVPTSGYNIWMGQMKFKLMHLRGKQESDDGRPSSPSQMYEDDLMPNFINDQENKASAADMGKLWRSEVPEQEKRYYSVICVEIRKVNNCLYFLNNMKFMIRP